MRNTFGCWPQGVAGIDVLGLTPSGADALKRLNALVEAAQDALLEPLSADERRELRRLLTRLAEHQAERRYATRLTSP